MIASHVQFNYSVQFDSSSAFEFTRDHVRVLASHASVCVYGNDSNWREFIRFNAKWLSKGQFKRSYATFGLARICGSTTQDDYYSTNILAEAKYPNCFKATHSTLIY